MRTFAQKAPSLPQPARRAEGQARSRSDTRDLATSAAPRITFDFAKVPLRSPTSPARLEVGSAADAHEKEADVASETGDTPLRAAASRPQLARTVVPSSSVAPAVDISSALQSRGQALEPRTRALMESQLGHDFRDVRIHTDAAAAASARSLNVRAYTFGRDIVFGSGEYAATGTGLRLLAHELAHVVQQSAGAPLIQCGPPPSQEHPSKSGPAKGGGNLVASLSASAADVQRKLGEFSRLKEWRGQFHTATDERLKRISAITKEWAEASAEWQEIQSHWYIFEHVSSLTISQRLNQLYDEISKAYWSTITTNEEEKKYEADSRKQEAALLAKQAAIVAEVSKLHAPGASVSQSQYESLMARLNQLSTAVDGLRDAEIRMQAKYTGSGPVSRPDKAAAQ